MEERRRRNTSLTGVSILLLGKLHIWHWANTVVFWLVSGECLCFVWGLEYYYHCRHIYKSFVSPYNKWYKCSFCRAVGLVPCLWPHDTQWVRNLSHVLYTLTVIIILILVWK
jgi:hypothetical protein